MSGAKTQWEIWRMYLPDLIARLDALEADAAAIAEAARDARFNPALEAARERHRERIGVLRAAFAETLAKDGIGLWRECTCHCHRDGVRAYHMRACCRPCPDCKRRIVGSLDAHRAECDGGQGR